MNNNPTAGITRPFLREERYYVLKISDMRKYLSREKFEFVGAIAEKLNAGRAVDGKTVLQAVVVEHDWPEYERAWQMIETRMNAIRPALAKQEQCEPLKVHDAQCPALIGDRCDCSASPKVVDKAWAQFCGGIGRGPDAPYPGMIEAFELHYGQSFTDKDWREETSVWAAAWKAAKATTPQPNQEQAEPVMTFDEVWDSIGWDEWRMKSIRDLVKMIHSKTHPQHKQRYIFWPVKGVRVDGDKVIIMAKGGNDAARWLCGEILFMAKDIKAQP